jgi:hypothetical protein
MVTNYPQAIATKRQVVEADQENVSMFERLRQMMCGLHGHDALVQFEQDRMFLRCVSCGHETHGWELNDLRRPQVSVREVPRAALARPHFVSERKIA